MALSIVNLTIGRLCFPASETDVLALARLLVDAVESGAAVSFRPPFGISDAAAWWRQTISDSDSRAIFLAARDGDEILGTVQLQPAWAPNQPHRGEICKLQVHRNCRRSGVGARLMRAIELEAAQAGFRLLTLNAKRGGPADRLYSRIGWTELGTIPDYALDPDGNLHDAIFYYKQLGSGLNPKPG